MKQRACTLLMLSFLAMWIARPVAYGANVYVGTCTHSTPRYPTISAAVAAAPAEATVNICPGTYAEQVAITKPLTLRGMTHGGAADVVIIPPKGGLVTNASTNAGQGGFPVAAQVLSHADGPVNLIDLTVDGTTSTIDGKLSASTCNKSTLPTYVVGVFSELTPGTYYRIETRHQLTGSTGAISGGCGIGVYGDFVDNLSQGLTIQSSDIHDFDYYGILMSGALSATNNFVLQGNNVAPNATGILTWTGTLRSNFVDMYKMQSQGIAAIGVIMATGNTIQRSSTGLLLIGKGSVVRGNRFVNNGNAIEATYGGESITDNFFTGGNSSLPVPLGIELACSTGNTITGNTFQALGIGIASPAMGTNYAVANNFYAIPEMQQFCQ